MKQLPECSFRRQINLMLAASMLAATANIIAPIALAAPNLPNEEADRPRETVIVGEVVETGCFVMAGRRGENHRQCALACARAGQPVGILEDGAGGTLHVAIFDRSEATPENPLLELLSERVEVRGFPVERGGVRGVVVKRVRSLK